MCGGGLAKACAKLGKEQLIPLQACGCEKRAPVETSLRQPRRVTQGGPQRNTEVTALRVEIVSEAPYPGCLPCTQQTHVVIA